MKGRRRRKSPSRTAVIRKYVAVLLMILPASALAQPDKPNVAILIYDGVQVIDHAIPFEVFGQFSLNNVYTVARDRGPITTYMGMQVVPNFSFADAPVPDVIVLPGGDASEAQQNPDIAAWIDRTSADAEYVLTVCTGIFFLEGNEILNGKQITTWYDRQAELQRLVPNAEVVSDRVVVESGKLVSSAGLGVDGALLVLARLHGQAWAEVVRLNMEYERIPDEHHIPRADLADLKLPGGVYSAFPWRDAELLKYEGDRDEWTMDWRFNSGEPLETLIGRFREALDSEEGWKFLSGDVTQNEWRSEWSITGADDAEWYGRIRLNAQSGQIDFSMHVAK